MDDRREALDLDAEYDTSRQLPGGNVGAYFEAFDAASRDARDAIAMTAAIRYGAHARESFDFFPAARPNAPLFVWVHGGYWRRMSKDQFSYVAPPIVAAGGAVAVLNYPLAPGPSLDEIVAAVRRGYDAALAHATAVDGVPSRVIVGGHSVGAQLAASIAAARRTGGLVAISGLYDLQPLRSTAINGWIAMDEACAARNSPLANPPVHAGPLVASVGDGEQGEFHRQQRAYVAAWRAWSGEVREIDGAGLNHFSIVLELARPQAPLTRATCESLGLHTRSG